MQFYTSIVLIAALFGLANTAPVAVYDEASAILARSYEDDKRSVALNAVHALNAVQASEKRGAALNAGKPAVNAVHALNAVQASEKREAALNAVWPHFPVKPASEKRKVAVNAVAAVNAVRPDSEKRHY